MILSRIVVSQLSTTDFIGCLRDVTIDGTDVRQQQPLFTNNTTDTCQRLEAGVGGACAAKPCLNGGTCVDEWTSFQCQCVAGYVGVVCADNGNVACLICCVTSDFPEYPLRYPEPFFHYPRVPGLPVQIIK